MPIKVSPCQEMDDTCELACPSCPSMVAITLDRDELGDIPSQGGTKINLVH